MCFTITPLKWREKGQSREQKETAKEKRERGRERGVLQRRRENEKEGAIKCRPWARGRHRGRETSVGTIPACRSADHLIGTP